MLPSGLELAAPARVGAARRLQRRADWLHHRDDHKFFRIDKIACRAHRQIMRGTIHHPIHTPPSPGRRHDKSDLVVQG